MAGGDRQKFDNPVIDWVDERLPIFSMMYKEYAVFPTPRNFNYLWNFGAIALVILLVMIVTGFTLSMYYTAHTELAFASVERIMRDVNHGWLLRYLHANGASMFFIAVYIHMARGMYYGSYKSPREVLWILGCLIFLLMMATAFTGYALVWGQMSFWGVTVISNLFSAIPLIGDSIVTWIWGGFSVDNPTLNRFFSFHFILPFVILAVVIFHVAALHITGSNNPTGLEPKSGKDTLPFHPFYTIKDTFGLSLFLILYAVFVFWFPNVLGHADNYIEANPLVTPAHIVPEWYFLPFYAILRAVPDKLGGVVLMFGAVGILFILPWLDRQRTIRSGRYRPLFKLSFWVFMLNFAVLTYIGAQPPEGIYVLIARLCTLYYFAWFLVILPLLPLIEKPRPVPASIHQSVLGQGKMAAAALLLACGLVGMTSLPALAAGEAWEPEQLDWSHHGPFGTYDRLAAQRGFAVYQQVCASCHEMKFMAFRHLEGIGFSENEIKAIAAGYQVMDGPDDLGEMFERTGEPKDPFPRPFANANAARAANNNAEPPNLSLMTKARANGENYVYSLLTGYIEPIEADNPEGDWHLSHDHSRIITADHVPEACLEKLAGQHCNLYFPGHLISMAPQLLFEGQIDYDAERNPNITASPEQMARDVTSFLAWAAEPKLEQRKRLGVQVILYLLIFSVLMYFVKLRVWKKAH